MASYAPLCKKQADYILRSRECWLNVAEGGKRAGKNIMNLIAWATCLDNHPDKIHLAAGVSISAARLNIIDSNGFGLESLFKGRCVFRQYEGRDALRIQSKTGEKIVLITGGGDAGSVPKIKGNTYGSVYVTEANECHKDFIEEVFTRTLTSQDRKIFFDLNPKPPAHWFYKDILDFYDKASAEGSIEGYNYEHFTVFDNLSISTSKIKLLLTTYDRSSLWYKRDILGLRATAEGLIYSEFSEEKSVYEELDEKIRERCLGYVTIDYGTANPCVFLHVLYDPQERVAYIDREYYYDGRKEQKQKSDAEYGEDILLFAPPKSVPGGIVIDPSALSFRVVLKRLGYRVKEANNDVLDGIHEVATLMSIGKLKVNRRCEKTLEEFGSYSWDEKAAEMGVEKPIKQNDHACDAIRYFVRTIIKMRSVLR